MNRTDNERSQHDAALISRVAAGDESAFKELYTRLAPGLFSLVSKILNDPAEAEDVLQEGFVQIWKKAATYNHERSSPFTWAVMILRNKAIDRLRARLRFNHAIEGASAELSSHENLADESELNVVRNERRDKVQSALGQIPGDQRQAIELAFFAGLTQMQISEKLGTPLGTVKARIRRGLLKLRDSLRGSV